MTNALSHQTQFISDTPYSYFAVPTRELDIALGNHALRAQPTDYSPICRLCCFPELTYIHTYIHTLYLISDLQSS